MIEKLSEPESYREKINTVFQSTDPFTDAGRDAFTVKAVLYPTNGYHLKESQFTALLNACAEIGENMFFVSQVEAKPQAELLKDWNWCCICPTYERYSALPLVIENAHYSSNGTWGILISHERHALLVSNKDFWDAFKSDYVDWDEDYWKFERYWNDIERKDWYERFMDSLTVKPTQK